MNAQILAPTAGKDYPQARNEFLDWFSTEDDCLAYLERLRWGDGFICPKCGSIGEAYRASRARLMCRACQHQTTVTAGTIFDKTHTPLRVWLAASFRSFRGASSLALRCAPIGAGAYKPLKDFGYDHQRTAMLGSEVAAYVSMAGAHGVAALLKRWILGTHHGSVQPEHLDAYLDEFVCRFNRRASGSRGMLFYRLQQQAVITAPVTYADGIARRTSLNTSSCTLNASEL